MEFNTVLFGFTAVSMSASFIGCLIGYHIREKRHAAALADSREFFSNERKALRAALESAEGFSSSYKLALELESEKLSEAETFIKSLREQNRLLEQGMDQVVLERKQWEAAHDDAVSKYSAQVLELKPYADAVWNALVIGHLPGHGSAQEQLDRIIGLEVQIALDPTVSKPAKNLMVRAKREHGKKLRAQHERLMQVMRDKANGYEELHRMAEEELVEAQRQLLVRQVALRNTCKDKLKLKGVRDSFKQAYWAEVSRLNSVQKETK